MIMNYHKWFNEQHRYLTGIRKGYETYNDTKWATINERYANIMQTMSSLLDEQPYGVVGNYAGFQQLIDLLERSNYTFEDIDQSLIDTYRMSLQNAMSSMLVNTHCVVANYKHSDTRHVHHDKYGHYYIVDVPFDQLHFGERDAFIREKLHAFYETENEQYLSSDRFLSDDISSVLGFTIICCTNGFMSDDWYVGIDEKGFRFKIGWKYSADVTLTVYKLDKSRVVDAVVDVSELQNSNVVPYAKLGIRDSSALIDCRCIVQISDESFRKDIPIAPNFGLFTRTGLQVTNLQPKTRTDFDRYNSTKARVRVYAVKYLQEISGVYPAVNYREMLQTGYVYDELGNFVTNDDGNRIHMQETKVAEKLPICTPPISLDRVEDNIGSFSCIQQSYQSIDKLRALTESVRQLGNACNTPYVQTGDRDQSVDYYTRTVLNPALYLKKQLEEIYANYLKGAIATSLISMDLVKSFGTLIENLDALGHSSPNMDSIQTNVFDTLFENNYKKLVDELVAPLNQPPFSSLGTMSIRYPNYYHEASYKLHRANRPVAEQCFIAMKYNRDDDAMCWVFDVPEIKHFKGIENAFYIDSDLKGDEVFKFFYLYTDTENPVEKYTEPLTVDQLMDFDEFTKEVDRHIGYIRYWHVDSQLMKLSHMFYQKDDVSTEISILSKILKRKIRGDVFLQYPSNMNYEISNVTTDEFKTYTETSMRAPFSVNFMFYTLSMLFNNEDKLASYFLHMLTRRKFHPRYADLKLTDFHDDTLVKEPINYSVISHAPDIMVNAELALCNFPDTADPTLYSGIPFPVTGVDHSEAPPLYDCMRYPYVFNQYTNDEEHPLLTNDGLDAEYYVKYSHIEYAHHDTQVMYDDARIANMVSIYLAEVYNGINQLVTYYAHAWKQDNAIDSLKKVIRRHYQKIQAYVQSRGDDFNPTNPATADIVAIFNEDPAANPVYIRLDEALYYARKLYQYEYSNVRYNIYEVVNSLITVIRKVYESTGFDLESIRYVRRVYLQLKMINSPMGIFQYRNWAASLDMDTLNRLHEMYSDNPNIIYTKDTVRTKVIQLNHLVDQILGYSNSLRTTFDSLNESVAANHLVPLAEYCATISDENIFGLYRMNMIIPPANVTTPSKPIYAEIRIPTNDDHVAMLIGDSGVSDCELLLQVKWELTGSGYQVTSLTPVCEYAFVDGTPMTASVYLYNSQMSEILEIQDVPITFSRVSLSSDVLQSFERYIGTQSIPLEVQNIHETVDVNGNNRMVNVPHAQLNYELLCGNHFTPLTKFSEYCNPPADELQGPIDKLYLSCEKMNELSLVDQSNRPEKTMYFKACQVFHITPNDESLTSIGGKYFVGQTVYAITDDGLSMFPIIITAIDHSQARGMLEAKVDEFHAKWFNTHDQEVITKYLTTAITCTLVDDNIRNFMDEYSDYDGPYYPIPPKNSTAYTPETLPGDPMFVESNPDYVYARLSWIFKDDIPRRDDAIVDPRHHFIYIGTGSLNNGDDGFIQINMINHNFNPYTDPELIPVLREEPDDHHIWKEEERVFKQKISEAVGLSSAISGQIHGLNNLMIVAKTTYEKRRLQLQINNLLMRQRYYQDFIKRLELYLEQLETPTTWYNVRSYDAAMVYINNGRAYIAKTINPHIQDISYTEKVDVRLYDWENQTWIDPSAYTVETHIEDGVWFQNDALTEYTTNDVLTSVKITFNDPTYQSARILVYFVYDHSDVFDDITLNDMECSVLFKPVLALDKPETSAGDPYHSIRIRKNYDENELYRNPASEEFRDEFIPIKPVPEDFPIENAIMICRPERSGTYTDGSPIRFCDMTVTIDGNAYGYDDFEIYIPHPMRDTAMSQDHLVPTYSASVRLPIDGFKLGEHVTLVCVSTNAEYNGVSSDVMFEAITEGSALAQRVTITGSSLPYLTEGTYTCYVDRSDSHPMTGGMIVVTVSHTTTQSETNITNWYDLREMDVNGIPSLRYRLIPKVFILVPKGEDVAFDDETLVEMHNNYALDTSHDVDVDNLGDNDLFTVYYDKDREHRYPIGDVRKNQYKKRLTIDLVNNQSIETIRTNYICVSRYVAQTYPQDGIIDLTGYIPTPLSRDRYEFWVNGRYVSDPNEIIILSPTSFQLRNMTSLKNLEVVELVDDIMDSALTPRGVSYIDIEGNHYGSYVDMMRKRANIVSQSVRYQFNQNTKYSLDEYLPADVRPSNNVDIEPDIMTYITTDEEITSYDQLYNHPTLNGVPIEHNTSASLGLMEYPNMLLLSALDEVWKTERLNGDMKFSHKGDYLLHNKQSQFLHVVKTDDGFICYTTGVSDLGFTLFITNSKSDKIDAVGNVLKIMPMLRAGVRIRLDASFEGKWLHSTIPNTNPILIQ